MKDYILYSICTILDYLLPKRYLLGRPVLFFHSISDKQSRISIKVNLFKKQMDFLAKQEYKTISPLDLYNNQYDKKILICFDDGFKDNYQIALPILKKYNFSATIFISTDYIGGQSSFCANQEDRNFSMLDANDIIRLENNGWFIANHFASHKNLVNLNDQEIVKEFQQAKNELSKIVKNKESIKVISYPRNKYNHRVIQAVKKAGATMGFGGESRLLRSGDNKLVIPRIEISRRVSFVKFKLLLSPSFYLIKSLIKGLI